MKNIRTITSQSLPSVPKLAVDENAEYVVLVVLLYLKEVI